MQGGWVARKGQTRTAIADFRKVTDIKRTIRGDRSPKLEVVLSHWFYNKEEHDGTISIQQAIQLFTKQNAGFCLNAGTYSKGVIIIMQGFMSKTLSRRASSELTTRVPRLLQNDACRSEGSFTFVSDSHRFRELAAHFERHPFPEAYAFRATEVYVVRQAM